MATNSVINQDINAECGLNPEKGLHVYLFEASAFNSSKNKCSVQREQHIRHRTVAGFTLLQSIQCLHVISSGFRCGIIYNLLHSFHFMIFFCYLKTTVLLSHFTMAFSDIYI